MIVDIQKRRGSIGVQGGFFTSRLQNKTELLLGRRIPTATIGASGFSPPGH
jgi:hypothetical protein